MYYTDLKSARVILREAAKRKDHSWWKLFARYAEIARRKLWRIEIGLLACLILALGGCHTASGFGDLLRGAGTDIKNASEGYLEENR